MCSSHLLPVANLTNRNRCFVDLPFESAKNHHFSGSKDSKTTHPVESSRSLDRLGPKLVKLRSWSRPAPVRSPAFVPAAGGGWQWRTTHPLGRFIPKESGYAKDFDGICSSIAHGIPENHVQIRSHFGTKAALMPKLEADPVLGSSNKIGTKFHRLKPFSNPLHSKWEN